MKREIQSGKNPQSTLFYDLEIDKQHYYFKYWIFE